MGKKGDALNRPPVVQKKGEVAIGKREVVAAKNKVATDQKHKFKTSITKAATVAAFL
jgi:hypothetical protein